MLIIFLASCGWLCRAADSETFTGRVIGVSDGDTISVMRGRKAVKVRLHGVDCPESKQPFGSKAKAFTSERCFKKTVAVQVVDTDRYGRLVGRVHVQNGDRRECLNEELVRAGLGWWYREYAPKDPKLQELEAEARAARTGLWSDDHATAPWDWRRDERDPDGVDAMDIALSPACLWLLLAGSVVGVLGSYAGGGRGKRSKESRSQVAIVFLAVEGGLSIAMGMIAGWWVGALFFLWMWKGARMTGGAAWRAVTSERRRNKRNPD